MRLQINMNCVECDEVWPVRVRAAENFKVEPNKNSVNKMDSSHTYEQIACPDCGEDNVWDHLNRNFIKS